MLAPALNLAAGTATDLDSVTSGLGNTMKAFGASSEEAAKYAKRMLVVYKGEVILDGKPGEIFLKEKNRLLEAGMDIPEVYKLADALRAKGLRLPYEITDAKRLLAEVKRRKGLK